MRSNHRAVGLYLFASLALAGCGPFTYGGNDVSGPPEEPSPDDIPTSPDEPPPTGQIWDEVIVDGDCGHQSVSWVLVDEVCGARDAQDYLARFRAPMFRDGVVIGSVLFTIDGTNLWTLDVSDKGSIPRKGLVGGLGTPLAVGAHNGRLVLAAGGEGVIVLDVTVPEAPERIVTLKTEGPALDVVVEGDRALVAMGDAGVGVIDLLADPPAIVSTTSVNGFAAGIRAQGQTAYVAACDRFVVVDLATGQIAGETWLGPDAYKGDFLVAPAKDVELVNNVAFVAAGRFGAVAIDVASPSAPALMGNCTIEDDLAFYASGVRAENGKVFVAGGEWGVLAIDSGVGCTNLMSPVLPDYPVPEGEGGTSDGTELTCSVDPPWEIVDWQYTWSPPAPGRDPIQVLPAGDVVYAFGDARRNALRAVDIKDASYVSSPNLGRYQEPRRATNIAVNGNYVVVLGEGGGVFVRDEVQLLVPVPDAPALPPDAVAISVLEDGRWVAVTESNDVLVNGTLVDSTTAPVWPFGVRVVGGKIAVADAQTVHIIDPDAGLQEVVPVAHEAKLPAALVPTSEGWVIAAPEWTQSLLLDGTEEGKPLEAHGVFDAKDIGQTSLWRRGVPSRMLLPSEAGIVEVATLGGRAGMLVHKTGGRVELPGGEYRGGATHSERAYLVLADRSSYRTRLVTVDIAAETPAILEVESFLGVGTGVAADQDRLYVADGDRGVRVYSVNNGEAALLGIVAIGEAAP